MTVHLDGMASARLADPTETANDIPHAENGNKPAKDVKYRKVKVSVIKLFAHQ